MSAQPLAVTRSVAVSKPASVSPTPAAAPTMLVPVQEPDMPVVPEPASEPVEGGDPAAWPDEAAESAFLADARERGEPVKATRAAVETAEDTADPKALPKLDDLVNRIPPEVRDTLEELFRAKFVKVQRVPKRALKG